MDLPIELRNELESRINSNEIKELINNTKNLSEKYRNESGNSKRLLTNSNEAIAYSLFRMPATYGAVYKALEHTFNLIDDEVHTLLDVGAGTGSVSWATSELLDIENITCLEREDAMLELGRNLVKASNKTSLKNSKWVKTDLVKDDIKEKADLVISSYVLNEMKKEERFKVLEKIWSQTEKVLLIIEPGTPAGYKVLMEIRNRLLAMGGKIIAPCTHEAECMLSKDDWCHATCRIARTKTHKQLKNAELPYEDEKFSYIAFSKIPYKKQDVRILRHPKIEPGKITLDICTENDVKKLVITKKDKPSFKIARKAKCGDGYNFDELNIKKTQ